MSSTPITSSLKLETTVRCRQQVGSLAMAKPALWPPMPAAENTGQHSQCWRATSLASSKPSTSLSCLLLFACVTLCASMSPLCLLIPSGPPHSSLTLPASPQFHTPFFSGPPGHHRHAPSCSSQNLESPLIPPFPFPLTS